MPGINTTIFKTHSAHSASTSCKGHCYGFPLTKIAKATGWTTFSRFAGFHNKPVNNKNFGSIILNGLYEIF